MLETTLSCCVNVIMDFLSESQISDHDAGLALFDKPTYTQNFQSQTDIVIQPISPPSDSQHASYSFNFGVKRRPYVHSPGFCEN